MSQSQSLRMELKPSWLLAGALAGAHLLALAAAVAALGRWPLLLVASGVLVSLVVTAAEALQRTAGSPRALELHEDGHCAWRDGAGQWHQGRLHGQRFVAGGLVVFALNAANGRRWIALPPDAADAENLRRLRGWLRWRVDPAHKDIAEA
jgi:hypothetical protein